ncbi:MAG: flagellar hook assembly protein FlgD [Dissulfurimicrobium sp.]|uniref:flagellar hook assembly protein FlgD n=1 Tax=Dissulfurimicrobium sp. TaxID=2022436 RepID=UPI00404A435F
MTTTTAITKITNATAAATANTQAASTSVTDRGILTRDDFMNLFIKQLQYQDPMQPMDTGEMATQISQLNMVDLMTKNNDAINKLVATDNQRMKLDAVGYLGRDVRYTGNTLEVGVNGPKPFDLNLNNACSSCVVTIKDSNGNLIKSWDLGALGKGTHALNWDGTDATGAKVAAGNYTVSINAKDDKGNAVNVTTLTTGTVSAISYQTDGMPLFNIKNGPQISINDIQTITS